MSETYPPPREGEIWRPDANAYIPAWPRTFLKTYGVFVQWAKGLSPLDDSLAYLWLTEDATPQLIWLRRHGILVQHMKGEGYQLDGSDVIYDSFRELIEYLKGGQHAVP